MLGGLIRYHDPSVEMVLVVRGEHGQALQQQGGVQLDGPWERRRVPVQVSFEPAAIADSDFLLLTVKSQATREAMQSAQPFLGDATVISLQNGINHGVLLELVDPQRLVMGMTATNMVVSQPGVVCLQLDGVTVVGPPPGTHDMAATRRAAALLRKTGLKIAEHANVQGVQYNKLAINALGYASCMSASNFISEAICYAPWRQSVAQPLLNECRTAFEAAGIRLAKIPGRPDVDTLSRFFRQLDRPWLGGVLARVARRLYDRKPIVFSLLQDLQRGKPTEVDFINGHIVHLARQHGQQAPCNALVCEMVHELERAGRGHFFSREDVIQRCKQVL
jgi:2-dehydropantoate 2-reductase